jgi:hypothetical protein
VLDQAAEHLVDVGARNQGVLLDRVDEFLAVQRSSLPNKGIPPSGPDPVGPVPLRPSILKDGDIKGQQPLILVNPLWHNGIISWRLAKMKQFPPRGNGFGGVTLERLAGIRGICPGPARRPCLPRRAVESWP